MAVQTKFRGKRVDSFLLLLAEQCKALCWTWLLGCITFPLLMLAVYGTYFTIAFFWGIFT